MDSSPDLLEPPSSEPPSLGPSSSALPSSAPPSSEPPSSEPSSSGPPSSPLSVLSKSPTLSPRNPRVMDSARYPSPLSTAPSGSTSPLKLSDSLETEICVNPHGPPPAKRRKIERKPRTTEHLSLHAAWGQSQKDARLLDQLTHALRKKKKVVVIAGAGISVSAGIPDFRSSNGLFATLKNQHKLKASGKQLFDASVYKHDSSTSSFHDMVRELAHLTRNAKATPFHHMIASMAEEGRLLRLYSQNVDCIDTSMGPLATNVPLNPKGPWPKTVQLHGGLEKMVCSKCGEVRPFDGSLFEGPEAPLCKGCEETDNVRTSHAGKRSHGIGRLRPRMVLYNEFNPDEDAIVNVVKADMRARPDAVVVVGTSMKIPGVRRMVKDMCQVTRARKDGLAVWINLEPEPSGNDLKDCWDLVVRGKSDDVASLVGLPRWDESGELDGDVKVDDKLIEEKTRGFKFEVRLGASTSQTSASPSPVQEEGKQRREEPAGARPKSIDRVQGMPTPTASPKLRTTLPTKPQQKLKQSQLSLDAGNARKPKPKPTGPRKPRPAKKAEPPPRNTLKSSFKATKGGPEPAAASKAPPKRPAGPRSPDLRSILASDFTLRPTAQRQSRESYGDAVSPFPQKQQQSQEEQKQKDHHPLAEAAENPAPALAPRDTPTRPSSAETISPGSRPRGLEALID